MLDNIEDFEHQIAFLFDSYGELICKTSAADQLLCSQFSPLNLLQIIKDNFNRSRLTPEENEISGFALQDFRLRQDSHATKLIYFSLYQLRNKNFLLIENFQDIEQKLNFHSVTGLEIIAGATHDLKNPMSAIYGFADTLLLSLEQDNSEVEPSEVKNIVRTIASTSRRAIELLRNYEQLFLMLNCGIKPQLQSCDLVGFINRELTNHPDSQGRISLTSTKKHLFVSMYSIHLERVISNLIQNAIKFSTAKDLIEISISEMEAGIELSIKNTGSYIAQSDCENIFKKYERVINPDLKEHEAYIKGTGLGLYIVASIVEAYKYQISVLGELADKKEESSTCFKVLFTSA